MATRNIVPRANNEGGVGTTSKKWGNIWSTLVNALTLTAQATGFTIAGGTTSKTLTVDETVALSAKANLISPSFTTPILGTPSSGILTNCSGFPGKNAIINGDFNVAQRGTSFAAVANGSYPIDRFLYGVFGDMVHTISQDTDVPTQTQSGHKSNYSLKIDCTTVDTSIAENDYVIIRQAIEGYNFAPFVGRTATLSFWVKATKTGIYCVHFRNSVSDRTYVTEYTVNTTNTWEKKTITLTFDYSGGTWNFTNGVGIFIGWILACGSIRQTTKDTWQTGSYFATSNQVNACDSTDNNFWLSQVQFELGSVATDFEYEQIGVTELKCFRYFFSKGGLVTNEYFSTGLCISTTRAIGSIDVPVKFRASPTLGYSDVSHFGVHHGAAVLTTATAITLDQAGLSTVAVKFEVASGLTAGNVGQLIAQSTSARLTFSAEL